MNKFEFTYDAVRVYAVEIIELEYVKNQFLHIQICVHLYFFLVFIHKHLLIIITFFICR